MKKPRSKEGKYIKTDYAKSKQIRVSEEEYRTILVNRFIKQVDEESLNNWQKSDLWEETERNLEIIANHLKNCENCFNDFGVWLSDQRPSFTLIDLGDFPENLEDWICQTESNSLAK